MNTEPIRDESNRLIAPPQAVYQDRPQGPWSQNAAPRAVFAFMQPSWDDGPGIALYHIIGGASDQSTVSAWTLQSLGIAVPVAVSA